MNRTDDDDYDSLRREVLLRIALQNLTLILLMPLFLGATIAAAAQPSAAVEIGLAYVGATGMGALYWVHSAARTVQMKAYLQLLETRDARGHGWEVWLASSRFQGFMGSRWLISTKGIFVGSQLAATVLCGTMLGDWREKPLALCLALLATLLTALLLTQPRLVK